jgi:cytidylate kinase
MPLIAMTREIGALSKEVAQGVADALGIPVVHHEIIEPLADKMRLRKSHVIKLLEGEPSFFDRLTADLTSLSIYTAEETFALAAKGDGAILLSWGAAHLLRPVAHVLCVRVCAPKALRVARLMERMGTSDERLVRHEVESSDEAHAAIVRRHFGVDWWDAAQYDLALNTERLPTEECVQTLLHYSRHPQFQETPESRARFENLYLEARVRSALRQDPRTRTVAIGVSADGGRLRLEGVVDTHTERHDTEEVAAAVPGVEAVSNELSVVAEQRGQIREE